MSKKNKVPVTYPFLTKSQIKARLSTDDAYVRECLAFLAERTASRQPGQKNSGFMSSHLKLGNALAAEPSLVGDQLEAARTLVTSYAKQLAKSSREEAIANDPSLAEVARIFSSN